MTPDHQHTIEEALQLAYTRTLEWNQNLAIPTGKNPPPYTREILLNSPLCRDLVTVASYVEGYQSQEDITVVLTRIARALFGHTLSQTGFRLPHKFHKTKLGELMFDAFARYYPPSAWMRTSEVQKLFGVQRQTIYDWAEEEKLTAFFVKGTQMFLRSQVEQFHATWLHQKQQEQHKRLVTQLGGAESEQKSEA
jgi:excisionase family DNA binding protein